MLRKKPPGELLPSAHAVDREYKLFSALSRRTEVPVPTTHVYSEDLGVCGTSFYLQVAWWCADTLSWCGGPPGGALALPSPY